MITWATGNILPIPQKKNNRKSDFEFDRWLTRARWLRLPSCSAVSLVPIPKSAKLATPMHGGS